MDAVTGEKAKDLLAEELGVHSDAIYNDCALLAKLLARKAQAADGAANTAKTASSRIVSRLVKN